MTERRKAYEQRTFRSSRSNERPTSQPKQRLTFPRSDKNALLQTSAWQPRGTDNRVKIILSERLVNSEGALESGNSDIVCFTFQHAPRGKHPNYKSENVSLTSNRPTRAGWYCVSYHRSFALARRRESNIQTIRSSAKYVGARNAARSSCARGSFARTR